MNHGQLKKGPAQIEQVEQIDGSIRNTVDVDDRFHGMLHRLDDLLSHAKHIESKVNDKVSQLVGGVPQPETKNGIGASDCLADKVHSYLSELQQTLVSIQSEVDRL